MLPHGAWHLHLLARARDKTEYLEVPLRLKLHFLVPALVGTIVVDSHHIDALSYFFLERVLPGARAGLRRYNVSPGIKKPDPRSPAVW